ncbi:hypothetical protein MA16_Dca002872 [Dendrobium catenatum]|uniref:Uncharacterized protein n=1 Tax=Dendrobium catenatum TaxID=906689 RepID=A0A2I0X8W6_9ASPA|nr:hypothetical protein MA16_Dca002872 [Dendrobium catenatum]
MGAGAKVRSGRTLAWVWQPRVEWEQRREFCLCGTNRARFRRLVSRASGRRWRMLVRRAMREQRKSGKCEIG